VCEGRDVRDLLRGEGAVTLFVVRVFEDRLVLLYPRKRKRVAGKPEVRARVKRDLETDLSRSKKGPINVGVPEVFLCVFGIICPKAVERRLAVFFHEENCCFGDPYPLNQRLFNLFDSALDRGEGPSVIVRFV